MPTIVSPRFSRPSRFSSERLSASAASRSAAISATRRSFSNATANGSSSTCASCTCSGLERRPVRRDDDEHAEAVTAQRQRPQEHVGFDRLRRDDGEQRLSAALVAVQHLAPRHQSKIAAIWPGGHSLRTSGGGPMALGFPTATDSTHCRWGSMRRTKILSISKCSAKSSEMLVADWLISICRQASRQTSSKSSRYSSMFFQ